MFTQRCFIRINSEEIRRKLHEIGYKTKERVDFEGIKINEQDQPGMYRTVYASCVNVGIPEKYGFIDCGTNEDLFLAIAALRDDSDIYQWFIHDDSDWNDEPNIFWYKCESESINDDMAFNLMCNDCRKATVEELIKKFSV